MKNIFRWPAVGDAAYFQYTGGKAQCTSYKDNVAVAITLGGLGNKTQEAATFLTKRACEKMGK